MSEAMSSIEEELKIPHDATLQPKQLTAYFVFENSEISINELTSIRKSAKQMPRCLVIGRQAVSADIRLDHKSISRKHAAIFFSCDRSEDETDEEVKQIWHLRILDCGGKKGTYINKKRITSCGKGITLKHGDSVQFGTFQKSFCVKIDRKQREKNSEESVPLDTETNKDDVATKGFDSLTGRERREAEIAAMMKSFDNKPAYTLFRPDSPTPAEETNKPTQSQSYEIKTNTNISSTNSLPVSHSTNLSNNNSKLTTSIATDPAGSRIIIGSIDASISMYDFGGMDSKHSAFKIINVEEEGRHPIMSISTSNTGDRFLVGTTSSQPSVFDRDGHLIIRFAAGDSYVTDMSRTAGHISTITSTSWHPLERDIVLTSSTDGSVRIWDLLKGKTTFQKHLKCSVVYRLKNKQGRRTGVACAAFDSTGRFFVAGTTCGSVQIWKVSKTTNSISSRPDQVIFNIHGGTRVNSVMYDQQGSKIASRGEDDSVLVWNAKNLRHGPLLTLKNIVSWYESSNCAFSPDGNVICATTSVKAKSGENGRLIFFNCNTNKRSEAPISELKIAPDGVSAVRVVWHPKLNQIFVSLSNGITKILYSRSLSKKGALLSTSRAAKTKDALELLLEARHPQGSTLVATADKIITPHALPMFQDENSRENKRKREEERRDPVKTRKPEPPSGGVKVKVGGQTSVQKTFQQFIAKGTLNNKNIAGKDPREELFKYSKGKNYINTEYMVDTKILAEKTAEEEEEDMKQN